MKKLIILLLFVNSIYGVGQNTWSYNYDLGYNNFLYDMDVYQDNIYCLSSYYRQYDTNAYYSNVGFPVINKNNGHLLKDSLSTIFQAYGSNRLIINNHDSILFIGTQFTGGSPYQITKLYQLNSNFVPIDSVTLNTDISINTQFIGVERILDAYYLYGTSQNLNTLKISTHIIKINALTLDIVWKKSILQSGRNSNSCYDLQETVNGDILYLNEYSESFPNGGFEIVKMDTAGNQLSAFQFDGSRYHRTFTSDIEGNIYFGTRYNLKNPYPIQIGYINKLSADMTQVLWSLRMPADKVNLNATQYSFQDFLIANNGDILTCGSSYDVITPSVTAVESGFITRFSKEGEIIWNRIFFMPNTSDIPLDTLGLYIDSKIEKIFETEEGAIIGGGYTYITPYYLPDDWGQDSSYIWLWLLKTDAFGCLEDEECQEAIILDDIIEYTEEPVFDIGTKWTYDYNYPGTAPNETVHSYITYDITSLEVINDSIIYTIENNQGLPTELMYQDREKIYFWDDGLQDWQLTYDFDANIQYPTQYMSDNGVVETTVQLKPAHLQYTLWFGPVKGVVEIQSTHIINNGTAQDTLFRDILYTCGRLTGGLRLGLGLGDTMTDYTIGDIRCFENPNFSFNFYFGAIDFPCDSIYSVFEVSTPTIFDIERIQIIPNPSTKEINITNIKPNTPYKLYDLLGNMVQEGQTSRKIDIYNNGTYILQIYSDQHWIPKKIIILK